MADFDSKNVYLTKGNEIIGIHAIGVAGPYEYLILELDGTYTQHKSDFQVMEIWGNIYDENHKMQGRGSFRIHNIEFDAEIKDWESDGWVRRDPPVVHKV